jgi:hypothetical protein
VLVAAPLSLLPVSAANALTESVKCDVSGLTATCHVHDALLVGTRSAIESVQCDVNGRAITCHLHDELMGIKF